MISADQIRAQREPRLMAKFDHKINLPTLFSAHGLSILPVSRGTYCISHFDAYFPFEPSDPVVHRAALPASIQSIDPVHISSESVAVNCALAAGIFADFAEDERLLPTVSGRMGSGLFDFDIARLRDDSPLRISVNNAQIEIDAALEGRQSLLLVEAKNDISSDFIIRQLFYPVRTWSNRVAKKIRPIFLVYSNSIFRLYEYIFTDISHYNSIELVQQKNYSIDSLHLTKQDIVNAFHEASVYPEPEIPFPQADNFPRVINLCE